MADIREVIRTGKDPVSSLGFDGPLAALDPNRTNLSDYFKEKVAVVTNPAIDRGREMEAFSTQTLVGARPEIGEPPNPNDILITLDTLLLTGGHPALGGAQVSEAVASRIGSMTIEKFVDAFKGNVACLDLGVQKNECVESALERLRQKAVSAAKAGIQCLILDDNLAVQQGWGWLDPHLASSVVDKALREADSPVNLRRRTGLILRSASIRNLHDIALLSGFGLDAVNPYAMLAISVGADEGQNTTQPEDLIEKQFRLARQINIGLEKVISTMGCHELRGYGRVCSSIGLSTELAECLNSPNFFGGEQAGLSWKDLDREASARAEELRTRQPARRCPKPCIFTLLTGERWATSLGQDRIPGGT